MCSFFPFLPFGANCWSWMLTNNFKLQKRTYFRLFFFSLFNCTIVVIVSSCMNLCKAEKQKEKTITNEATEKCLRIFRLLIAGNFHIFFSLVFMIFIDEMGTIEWSRTNLFWVVTILYAALPVVVAATDDDIVFEWPVLARYDKPHYDFDYTAVSCASHTHF